MYQLYYSPGVCSLAIHALLIELGQPFELINKSDVEDFATINLLGAVPVLRDGDMLIREGAAIVLHLVEKHGSDLLPAAGTPGRANALQWLLYANATVHPAYSKLFFVARALDGDAAQGKAFEAAASAAAKLWSLVDEQLGKTRFVTGDKVSIADIMLTVYANWGGYFPVDIPLGENVRRMVAEVSALPSFQQALGAEGVEYKAAA